MADLDSTQNLMKNPYPIRLFIAPTWDVRIVGAKSKTFQPQVWHMIERYFLTQDQNLH